MENRENRKYHDLQEMLFPKLGPDGKPLLDVNGNPVREKKMGMPVLLKSVEELQTKKGGTYCRCTIRSLYTKTEVQASVWDAEKEKFCKKHPERTPIWVELELQMYNGNPSFVIRGISEVPDDVQFTDFLVATPYNPTDMYAGIMKILGNISAERADFLPALIARQIYDEDQAKLMYWPAAKNMHHDCYGGLIYHNYRQVVMGHYISRLYSDAYQNESVRVGTDAAIVKIQTMLDSFPGECTDLAKSLYATYYNQISANPEAVYGILRRMTLANCIMAAYRGADPGIVFSAIALRPLGELVYADMPEKLRLLGPVVSTIELIDEALACSADMSEQLLILKHCIASQPREDLTSTIKNPAVKEAFVLCGCEWIDNAIAGEQIDGGMLISAAALHDIGKLIELDSDTMGIGDYSVTGNFLGHLCLGVERVNAVVREHPEWDPTGEHAAEVDLLKHCLLSHHKKLEWDAVVEPITPEAKTLFALDYLDSRMYIVEKSEEAGMPGCVDDGTAFALRARVYRPVFR